MILPKQHYLGKILLRGLTVNVMSPLNVQGAVRHEWNWKQHRVLHRAYQHQTIYKKEILPKIKHTPSA